MWFYNKTVYTQSFPMWFYKKTEYTQSFPMWFYKKTLYLQSFPRTSNIVKLLEVLQTKIELFIT